MASRKKKGPKHPGVVLIKPDSARRIGWRARFVDPDTGKTVKVSLDVALTTVEQRAAWAVNKSRQNAQRRIDLEKGAVRATGTKLSDALKLYFKAHGRLRAATTENYQRIADKFEAWAKSQRIDSCDKLTRSHLMDFAAHVSAECRRVHSAGSTRRTLIQTDEPRSAATVNSELTKLATILRVLIERDLFPKLTDADLRRALKKVATTSERSEFLSPAQCQALIKAVIAHDAETFKATRREHAGKRPAGSTPRYDPVAPLVAFILLTGCRFGEALSLTWPQVELDALDAEGNKVGEIHLRGSDVKTRTARTIGLDVSPALRALLAGLREQSGTGKVFKLTRPQAEAAAKRLRADYGAPEYFTWQTLRRTCGTYLTNAPGIFGAASAYRSARQLGHSVTVAEKHYLGLARGISRDARSVEAAMQVGELVARIGGELSGGNSALLEASGESSDCTKCGELSEISAVACTSGEAVEAAQ
ncbi:MAG: hypothetical protein JWN04_4825 [Myxococcaceae bacterium]|nr:hypothetical protein [Myxococcaceae bacterium]